jgi:hypothetical protein
MRPCISRRAECRAIHSIWGHIAPFNPPDMAFIEQVLRELLAEE